VFDLAKDQRERASVARRHPEKFVGMKRRYLDRGALRPGGHAAGVVKQKWGPDALLVVGKCDSMSARRVVHILQPA
jgi:hypothetical protein